MPDRRRNDRSNRRRGGADRSPYRRTTQRVNENCCHLSHSSRPQRRNQCPAPSRESRSELNREQTKIREGYFNIQPLNFSIVLITSPFPFRFPLSASHHFR